MKLLLVLSSSAILLLGADPQAVGPTVKRSASQISPTVRPPGSENRSALESGSSQRPATVSSSIPGGMVAFFMAESCPTGWSVATAAQGRLLVGVTSSSEMESLGEAMTDRYPRPHEHAFAVDVQQHKKYAVFNNYDPQLTAAAYTDTLLVNGNVNEADNRLPFVQLLACRKQEASADKR